MYTYHFRYSGGKTQILKMHTFYSQKESLMWWNMNGVKQYRYNYYFSLRMVKVGNDRITNRAYISRI